MKLQPKVNKSHNKPQHAKKAVVHTQKRNKVWKKRLAIKIKGDKRPEGNTPVGHLQGVIKERVIALKGVTLSDIKPTYVFPTLPNKENNWSFSQKRPPGDFQHRVLSYMDQFNTPVRPKQIINHFVNHPTKPAPPELVYGTLKKLANYHNIYKIRKIDEEGQEHWFLKTSTQSRVRHNRMLGKLITKQQPLPLEEVVWEEIDESKSWANFREMKQNQQTQAV